MRKNYFFKRILALTILCAITMGLLPLNNKVGHFDSSNKLSLKATFGLSNQVLALGTQNNSNKISTGFSHSLAIKKDASLWTWGWNIAGQLGDGSNTDINTPAKIMDNVATVSANSFHSLAIKKDETLWVWGRTDYGLIGYVANTENNTPTKIMDNVTAISTGGFHSLAIKSDATLWVWGINSAGQLGDGTYINKDTPTKIMENILAVSAGNEFSLAIKNDGSLWAWGANTNGQLGDGSNTKKNSPTKIMDNVSTIAAGMDHSIVIKNDGSLWAWGKNNYGQLGDGTNLNKNIPTKIMDNVLTIPSQSYHSLAIKNDGTLWTWGYNSSGQLGDGTNINKNIPTKILDNVLAAAAGGVHSLAMKDDGSLWAWGLNDYGQIGDGTNTKKNVPTRIISTGFETKSSIDKKPLEEDLKNPFDTKNLELKSRAEIIDKVKSEVENNLDNIKNNDTNKEFLSSYLEYAIEKSTEVILTNQLMEIDLRKEVIESKLPDIEEVSISINNIIKDNNVELNRPIKKNLSYKISDEETKTKVILHNDIIEAASKISNITFSNKDTYIGVKTSTLQEQLENNGTISIELEKIEEKNEPLKYAFASRDRGFPIMRNILGVKGAGSKFDLRVKDKDGKVINKTNANINVGLPVASLNTDYNTVFYENEGKKENLGGKFNSSKNKIDVKTNQSGTYYVVENKKSFSDISSQDPMMIKAIEVLASKGIINGRGIESFDPDASINRSEFTRLIIGALSIVDDSANADFSDTPQNAWYYKYVATARKKDIISGYPDKTFKPENIINKQEIIKVCAATLQVENGYSFPKNEDTYITFKDKADVPDWVRKFVALANREGLIIKRQDGNFIGSKSTNRGEAAVMLYKMFQKI